ncbi:MAG: hypothetical protein LAN36_00185 [Acidobacteriia bacterium]|nr:hypothetical protein [Terriglobia bacterium]
MRVFAACLVALGLVALPAMAGTGGAGDKDGAAGSNAPAATAKPANPPAAAPKADAAGKAEPSSLVTESELQQLRDLLDSQSKQLQEQQQRMQLLEEQLSAASAAREGAVSSALAAPANAAIEPTMGVPAAAQNGKAPETPNSIAVKGITITPIGFMAAESAWRQRALSADVNSPFNSIPLPGSPFSKVSEFNASGRQSRFGALVEGKLSNVKIGGYYELDFLSAGVTSNYNQSNSFTLRQRQFWAQAAFNSGWTFTGGQMWSLVTETKKGLDNRTEAAPLTIDAQYNVGFSWARQYGFRVTKNFDNKVWLGFSIENAETTVALHGQNNNFLIGAPGAGGGLLNPIANFAFTTAPDFVFKAAFEPGFGHYEVFGVVSTFRDRIYPNFASATNPAAGAFNDHRVGGGVGANIRMPVTKKADVAFHFMGGDGVGRYGTTSLPDATVRPDGTLALIKSFQGLATIELHPTSKLDIYLYGGGEYAGRTQFTKAGSTVGPNEGYGATGLPNFGCFVEPPPGSSVSTPTGVGGGAGFVPGSLASCTGDTRTIFEGTAGFWYRFYKGSKGTVQFGPQYSYLQRNTWRGIGDGTVTGVGIESNGAPHSSENMVFTSFRYVLP